jgi:hypothetical protein
MAQPRLVPTIGLSFAPRGQSSMSRAMVFLRTFLDGNYKKRRRIHKAAQKNTLLPNNFLSPAHAMNRKIAHLRCGVFKFGVQSTPETS